MFAVFIICWFYTYDAPQGNRFNRLKQKIMELQPAPADLQRGRRHLQNVKQRKGGAQPLFFHLYFCEIQVKAQKVTPYPFVVDEVSGGIAYNNVIVVATKHAICTVAQ